ncbi:antibiotic biosynthesis monooxygenase [Rhodopila sp.]|uniref:antibiotic biosynthesis monooxygenase n=1 Tax=Rhodopila sp. TaxID=2480087 RepID=UPI003D129C4D
MKDDRFVLLVTIPVKPGCEHECLALINEVIDAMRHEPTFVNTVLHRSADDPGLFMLHETWMDRDDFFSVQLKRPYRADYEARLPDLLRAPREMTVFEPLRADYIAPTGLKANERDRSRDVDIVAAEPIAVIQRFHEAENAYMNAGGASGGASFRHMADTLDPQVVLHQSPDLPWGGEYRGHAGYEEWARTMSDAFDQLEVRDARFLTADDIVIILCRLVTRSRKHGDTLDLPMTQMVKVRSGKIVEFRPFYWNVPAYRSAV